MKDWYKKYVPGMVYLLSLIFAYRKLFAPVAMKAYNYNVAAVLIVIAISGAVSIAMSSIKNRDLNTFEDCSIIFVISVADCIFVACLAGLFHLDKLISLLSWS